MPGCSVSLTTESFCSVVNRLRRATPVMTSTFENVSDIGLCLGLCLAPPANAGVRSKRGAVQGSKLMSRIAEEPALPPYVIVNLLESAVKRRGQRFELDRDLIERNRRLRCSRLDCERQLR